MDPHSRPSETGAGSFWSGYGYDQQGRKGTGASEPPVSHPDSQQQPQLQQRLPSAPQTQGPGATGVGPHGGGASEGGMDYPAAPTPGDGPSSPGSLKVRRPTRKGRESDICFFLLLYFRVDTASHIRFFTCICANAAAESTVLRTKDSETCFENSGSRHASLENNSFMEGNAQNKHCANLAVVL